MSPQLLREPSRYADVILSTKGLGVDAKDEVTAAIDNALDRLYRAIAVDIDGTLTTSGDTVLQDGVAEQLRDFQRRGIPVILVTGRGDEKADEAVQALQAQRPDQTAGRLHCIIRNGAAILHAATAVSRRHEELIVPEALPDAVWNAVEQLGEPPNRIRPQRFDDRQVGSVRLEFSTEEERELALEQLLTSLAGAAIEPTRGRFQNIFTINLTPGSKRAALNYLASELGLSPEEILRVGDEGGVGGNDADLLDSIGGFSVGQLGSMGTTCHPVVDDDGNVMAGADATVTLLEGVYIATPIKRTHDTVTPAVIRRFGDVERAARATADREVRDVETAVARSFASLLPASSDGLVGPASFRLADLFDPANGAVRLRDYELHDIELPPEHPAAQLFQLEKSYDFPPTCPMAMASDSGILLRGSLYYHGFDGVEERTQHRVAEFLKTCSAFIEQATMAIYGLADARPSLTHMKLVLGVADHVRNMLLQCLNLTWTSEAALGDFPLLPGIAEATQRHLDAHLSLLLRNADGWGPAIAQYGSELASMAEAFAVLEHSPIADIDDTSPGKSRLRDLREADHLAQNVAAISLAIKNHRRAIDMRRGQHVTCFGLPYGGIELPFIARFVGAQMDLDVTAGLMDSSLHNDAVKGSEIRNRTTRSVRQLTEDAARWPTTDDVGTVLVADDNLTTASTLQLAVDFLAVEKKDVAGAIVVQYPTVNRRVHMALENHGCADPDALLRFVRGLVVPSPYTRLLVEGPTVGDRYRDRCGVFNKSKHRIERLLYKNYITDIDPDASGETEVEPPSQTDEST